MTKIQWTANIIERFWSYVSIRTANECWPWTRGCFESGYGQYRVGPRKMKAHRVAFELTHGRRPFDLVLHSCDNPPCCNPAHFFEGSHADNAADRRAKGRSAKLSIPVKHGEDNPAAKLCAGQVLEILALLSAGRSQRDVAGLYRISQSQILNIAKGRSWQALTRG